MKLTANRILPLLLSLVLLAGICLPARAAEDTAETNILISVALDEEYDFSSPSLNGASAKAILSDILGGYQSIRFGSIRSGVQMGTLYGGSQRVTEALMNGTAIVERSDVGKLVFMAKHPGIFRIEYAAYTDSGARGELIARGLLTFVAGADALRITTKLDSTEPFTLESPFKGGSVSERLFDALGETVGATAWNFIRFEAPPADSARIGALRTSRSSTQPLDYSKYLLGPDLKHLWFVPERSGAFEIPYGVYNREDMDNPLAMGYLRFEIAGVSAEEKPVIAFSAALNETLALSEAPFEALLRARYGSDYRLDSVEMSDFRERGYGSFSCNGEEFEAFGSGSFYAENSGKAPTGARLLKDVFFQAPAKTGYQAVGFTCYGSSPARSLDVQVSGTFFIFVTRLAVPEIVFDSAGSTTVSLDEESFAAAYRAAMGAISETPQFHIRLLTLPQVGRLNFSYVNPMRPGVQITSENADDYPLYINGGTVSGQVSVSRVTYVAPAEMGEDTASYIAYDRDGKGLFSGTIRFVRGEARVLSAPSEGLGFTEADFRAIGSFDPVLYVTLRQSSQGTLYSSYANGQGTPIREGDRFYVSNPPAGSFALSALRYIPRSGTGGETAKLAYTVQTANGATYSNTLTLKNAHKTASSVFQDVTAADVGSWAADSIDFAREWGLVGGTSEKPPLFSPSATMRRCDLVLILYRMAGSPAVAGELPYSDVSADAYYRASALWAAQKGIVEGPVSGTLYEPETAVTRQDFARILFNYARSQGADTADSGSLSAFRDAAETAPYAYSAMAWAVAKGYINGVEADLLSPAAAATRAQVATLLHRYLTF